MACGGRPDHSDDRDGPHTGLLAYAESKRTPRAASARMCGIFAGDESRSRRPSSDSERMNTMLKAAAVDGAAAAATASSSAEEASARTAAERGLAATTTMALLSHNKREMT